MTRELIALRSELRELGQQLDEVASQLRVHIAQHHSEEQYRREMRDFREHVATSQRWYRERVVQLFAAILGSSAVGALVSQLVRGH